MRLLPFQRRWLRETFRPETEISALSCPRGSGKTTLAAYVAADYLTPGHARFDPNRATFAVAPSLDQARETIVQSLREHLDARGVEGFRWTDSANRITATHAETGKRFRILSSSGKRAMGLRAFDLIIMDEPGSLDERNGTLLWRAVTESLGKMEGQRVIAIGTRSPAELDNWWPRLIDGGSGRGVHVSELTAPEDAPWDAWLTVRRANPLLNVSASLRRTVLRERDAARKDPALRRSYEAFRLNRSVNAAREALLAADLYLRAERRPTPPRRGRPIVALDAGSGRAWSAAVAIWQNGRAEAWALTGGVPALRERERMDGQRRGLYAALAEGGRLIVDHAREVPRLPLLIDHLTASGVQPSGIICDHHRAAFVRDAVRGRWPVTIRRPMWREATEDIGALRALATDGPLSIEPRSRGLFRVALREAEAESDTSGNVRPVKRRHERSRDDVALALMLACGALERVLRRPRPSLRLHRVG